MKEPVCPVCGRKNNIYRLFISEVFVGVKLVSEDGNNIDYTSNFVFKVDDTSKTFIRKEQNEFYCFCCRNKLDLPSIIDKTYLSEKSGV